MYFFPRIFNFRLFTFFIYQLTTGLVFSVFFPPLFFNINFQHVFLDVSLYVSQAERLMLTPEKYKIKYLFKINLYFRKSGYYLISKQSHFACVFELIIYQSTFHSPVLPCEKKQKTVKLHLLNCNQSQDTILYFITMYCIQEAGMM